MIKLFNSGAYIVLDDGLSTLYLYKPTVYIKKGGGVYNLHINDLCYDISEGLMVYGIIYNDIKYITLAIEVLLQNVNTLNPIDVALVGNSNIPVVGSTPILPVGIYDNGGNYVSTFRDSIRTLGYTLTRSNDTVAYAAGDVINNTPADAISFQKAADVDNCGVVLLGLRCQINSANAAYLGRTFRLHLYRDSDVALINDNDPFIMLYNNADKLVGFVDFTMPTVADGASTTIAVQVDNINKAFQLVGNNIYAKLQTLDAFTPLAATQFYLQLHVMQTR